MPGEKADAVAGLAGPDGGASAATKARKGKGGGGKKAAKEPAKPAAEKKARAPKPPKPPREKKLSGLDAAALVLKKAGKPMNFKDITEKVLALGWKTSGKTPQATLYAAAIREIAAKGKQARFKKTDRGLFEHTVAEGE
jgi:hypothetical protein